LCALPVFVLQQTLGAAVVEAKSAAGAQLDEIH